MATWSDSDLTKASVAGMVFGGLLVLLVSVVYLNLLDYQPVPQCAEDEVIYYADYPEGDLVCVHIDKFLPRAGEQTEYFGE